MKMGSLLLKDYKILHGIAKMISNSISLDFIIINEKFKSIQSDRRKDVLVLQPGSEEWLLLGEMKTPRSRAVIVNFGYQMMVIGGCDKGCPAEQFTPGLGTFGVSHAHINSTLASGRPLSCDCS